jgi:hypothetical protein
MKRYVGDELIGKTVRVVNRREEYASQFNGEVGKISGYRSVNRMYRYAVVFPSGVTLECRGYEVEVEEGEAA